MKLDEILKIQKEYNSSVIKTLELLKEGIQNLERKIDLIQMENNICPIHQVKIELCPNMCAVKMDYNHKKNTPLAKCELCEKNIYEGEDHWICNWQEALGMRIKIFICQNCLEIHRQNK